MYVHPMQSSDGARTAGISSRVAVFALLALCGAAGVQAQSEPFTPSPRTTKQFRTLLANPRVKQALESIKKDDERTFKEQVEISQIPAPPFKETVRAQDYLRRIREAGLTDATIDREGNVVAVRKGSKAGPTLVLSAHLDTVFPESADVTVREKDGRYYGLGLSDDSSGLAAILSVLRAMQAARIETIGQVVFVGTVGEEGLGDLRGVKALFRDRTDIDGFISVDSPLQRDEKGTIVSQATGSHRWQLTFAGPGGHSFEDFGQPSAVHAMGRAIAYVAELKPAAQPKTTFTVGVVSGGTAINAIAAEASMMIDIRSNSPQSLLELESKILAAADKAVVEENARWGSSGISVQRKLLSDRPAGSQSADNPLVQAAAGSVSVLGHEQPSLSASSTDSNLPMSLGIPAVTLPAGGRGGKFHSPDEWYSPTDAWIGRQAVLLTVLASVGVKDAGAPMLTRATRRAQKE